MAALHDSQKHDDEEPLPFLRGGGEMGERLRAFDWASTPLGPTGQWTSTLRSLVTVMLASPQPMFLIWGPRRIRLYNDAYRPILGNKHPHGFGRPLFDVWSEVQSRVEPMIDLAFTGEPIARDSFDVVINRHGHPEETQFSFSYTPVWGTSGMVDGIFGVCTETTASARQQHEDVMVASALTESEVRYRSLFDSMNEGYCIIEFLPDLNDFRYVAVNPAFKRVTGVDDAEGRTLRQLFPLNATAWIETYERVVLTREPCRFQRQLSNARTLELYAYPVLARDLEVAVIFADVTTRVDAEQLRDETKLRLMQANTRLTALRVDLEQSIAARTAELTESNIALAESARFNREIFDAIPGLVSFYDVQERCRFANDAYLRWVGKPAEEIMGRSRSEVFDDHVPPEWEAAFQDGLSGIPAVVELKSRLAEPDVRFLQVHYLPARSAIGAIRGIYTMGFDITELKRAETGLRASNDALSHARDAAEAASRAKSVFLANISHELRTPLNAIIGLAYILKRDPREHLRLERLDRINEAGNHLLKVIDQVLDLTKIEAGKLTLEETAFSLNGLFEKAIGMIGPEASRKGLLAIYQPATPDGWVRGDSTRLSQMVLNLLSNAVKFTHTGQVTCSLDVLSRSEHELTLRCSVTDTGEGISEHAQGNLFEAFEQADNSTTRRFGGTGLGLAITKQLASAMRGSVGLCSQPGVGSTFWFTATLATLDFFAPPIESESQNR